MHTHTQPELWRAPTSTQTSDWINPDLFLPSFNSLTDHTHTHKHVCQPPSCMKDWPSVFSVNTQSTNHWNLDFLPDSRATRVTRPVFWRTQRLLHKNFLQFYFHSVKWAIPETVGEDGHGQSQTTHFSVNSTQKGQYLNKQSHLLSELIVSFISAAVWTWKCNNICLVVCSGNQELLKPNFHTYKVDTNRDRVIFWGFFKVSNTKIIEEKS